MMGELKPCPFCGGTAEVYKRYPPFGRRVRVTVRCMKCRCNSGEWGRTDKAIEAWNMRAELQWIPCSDSERLPKKGQECLTCDNGKIDFDKFLGYGNPYNWEWYLSDHEAWMPLPEPYAERMEE